LLRHSKFSVLGSPKTFGITLGKEERIHADFRPAEAPHMECHDDLSRGISQDAGRTLRWRWCCGNCCDPMYAIGIRTQQHISTGAGNVFPFGSLPVLIKD